MTDTGIICAFMEPRPDHLQQGTCTTNGWWVRRIGGECEAASLTLDALHEVEEKLTDEQWDAYYHQFGAYGREGLTWTAPDRLYKWALHASAEQKIKALAAVLRPAWNDIEREPEVAAKRDSLRAELAKAIEGQGILGAEIANLRAELAASQERERVLREALEPFAGMAERFFALAEGKPVVEDEDRVTCEYVWLEFRHVLKVRDLRRAARALTPDRPYTSPSPERPSTADEGLSISGQETEGNHNA
jgi:hypothetical protein